MSETLHMRSIRRSRIIYESVNYSATDCELLDGDYVLVRLIDNRLAVHNSLGDFLCYAEPVANVAREEAA